MTDKDKLKEIKKLADAMYYAAFNLTTDASRLKKAMDEYHQFIIQEYCKEEPVSEGLIEATNNYCVNVRKGYPRVMDETDRYICDAFKAGAKWQKEQLRTDGDRTMSKAEKFISEHTRNTYNYNSYAQDPIPWLTPDQARRAVEIAKNEMVERACSFIADNIGEYIELKHANPTTFIEIDGDRFANDLKQAMKDE